MIQILQFLNLYKNAIAYLILLRTALLYLQGPKWGEESNVLQFT